MNSKSKLEFKIASEEREFEEIHKLNYETFVKEIPQHNDNFEKKLVDKFHHENTYIICKKGKQLAGMLAVRSNRPFSLDQKLENLDSYLPNALCICEIRMLSIRKHFRSGLVIKGLLVLLTKYCTMNGYDLGIISATTNQLRLYERMGFVPFGPLVGKHDAMFQPMYLTPYNYNNFKVSTKVLPRYLPVPSMEDTYINLLPGPVSMENEIRQEFSKVPVSHRSRQFVSDFQITRRLLTELTYVKNVEILMGSGSLANDAIAAQLSVNLNKGLLLCNGEFGNRLIDHVRTFGLSFKTHIISWGSSFNYKEIERILDADNDID